MFGIVGSSFSCFSRSLNNPVRMSLYTSFQYPRSFEQCHQMCAMVPSLPHSLQHLFETEESYKWSLAGVKALVMENHSSRLNCKFNSFSHTNMKLTLLIVLFFKER
uniref:Uncharacterized protein n=1 Tax=Leptobrachium leishanense TaxID=445787 RepID=A0A8C5MEZ3_9ANUR